MATDVITIDGPTSSGKNSVGVMFSQKIGYRYLDTGSIYRAFTLHVLNNNIPLDEDKIVAALKDVQVDYIDSNEKHAVLLNGENVAEQLNSPEVTATVADVAKLPRVREIARQFQRALGSKQNTVMAGRDIGTEIFPDARLKFFLTADPEVRAKRRFEQLHAQDPSVTFESVLHQLLERDNKDMTRKTSPMRIPEDAVVVDTTNLTVEQSVAKMMEQFMQSKDNS